MARSKEGSERCQFPHLYRRPLAGAGNSGTAAKFRPFTAPNQKRTGECCGKHYLYRSLKNSLSASHTVSCWASVISGNIGSETISSASFSDVARWQD